MSKVIQRIKDRNNVIEEKKIVNGNLIVNNVPHVRRPEIGPDGENFYIQSDVMYNLSKIFHSMIVNGIKETSYNEGENNAR